MVEELSEEQITGKSVFFEWVPIEWAPTSHVTFCGRFCWSNSLPQCGGYKIVYRSGEVTEEDLS